MREPEKRVNCSLSVSSLDFKHIIVQSFYRFLRWPGSRKCVPYFLFCLGRHFSFISCTTSPVRLAGIHRLYTDFLWSLGFIHLVESLSDLLIIFQQSTTGESPSCSCLPWLNPSVNWFLIKSLLEHEEKLMESGDMWHRAYVNSSQCGLDCAYVWSQNWTSIKG